MHIYRSTYGLFFGYIFILEGLNLYRRNIIGFDFYSYFRRNLFLVLSPLIPFSDLKESKTVMENRSIIFIFLTHSLILLVSYRIIS